MITIGKANTPIDPKSLYIAIQRMIAHAPEWPNWAVIYQIEDRFYAGRRGACGQIIVEHNAVVILECGELDEIFKDFIQTRHGYCFYEVEQGRNAIIFNLYVHHQYRRHGHARELLQYCIDQIRKSGHDGKIDIEVAPREESISCENLAQFYESMGLNVLWRDDE